VSENNKNLLLAFALALVVLLGWDYFVTRPMVEKEKARQAELAKANPTAAAPATAAAAATKAGTGAAPTVAAQPAIQAGRVDIATPRLKGSINLAGARLDTLTLTTYRETIKAGSPNIELLRPSGSARPYFVEPGWIAAAGSPPIRLPDANTVWTASATSLAPGKPVTLSWDNGAGQLFKITYAVDEHYLFTVTQTVENKSAAAITVNPYALISRTKPDKVSATYVLHEGPLGVFETLEEVNYKDLEGDEPVQSFEGAGGWLGYTDKYWLTAIIPATKSSFKGSFRFTAGVPGRHQADAMLPAVTAPAGGTAQSVVNVFAGAKEVRLIEMYKAKLNATLFDRAIDWGWFWYLTKPIFWTMDWFYTLVGNFGVAIILLTLLIKLIMYPIANKAYVSMNRMKILQPKMKEIQERYADDKPRQQQEIMEFMRKEKLNPLGGCLPILLQIPVFYALYKVLFVTIEMRHQPFVLWIKDLSAPDPLTPVNLFGLLPFTPPSILAVGILPILMGITMWLQMKLSPTAITDPIQQRVFSLLPFIFTFMMAPFAAGLVLYWTVNNILSILQQWVMLKRMEASDAKAAAAKAKGGGKAA
jgi:YidC/Oxa1 family membrane protein insertase